MLAFAFRRTNRKSLDKAERSLYLIQPCDGREQRSDYAGHQPIGAGHGLLHYVWC